MNVLIIPSWYPSESYPHVGIFFKEQARLMALAKPDWNVGVSTWGSHEPQLWIHRSKPLESLIKLGSKFPLKQYDHMVDHNCVEFFTPACTWVRSIRGGNINGITNANLQNVKRFEAHFGKIDLIHAHVAYPAGAVGRNISELLGVPYVVTEHMSPFPMASFKRSAQKYLVPPLKAAHAVLAVGDKLREELKTYGIQSRLIRNFVDLDQFKPRPFASEVPHIFTLGRLDRQKNFGVLISALSTLKQKSWNLTIGGDGSELKKLKSLVKKNQLDDRINFVGAMDRDEVVHQMQHSSFFVLPSLHESFGVVALEAMACGKPVITTKNGGIDLLMSHEQGLIIGHTQEELTTALAEMLDTYDTYSSDRIRKFVEEGFSASAVCAKLEKIYEEITIK